MAEVKPRKVAVRTGRSFNHSVWSRAQLRVACSWQRGPEADEGQPRQAAAGATGRPQQPLEATLLHRL